MRTSKLICMAALKFAMEYGLEGMVLGDTWMFIKTFEEMRKDLIKKEELRVFFIFEILRTIRIFLVPMQLLSSVHVT